VNAGVDVLDVASEAPSLEDVFAAYTSGQFESEAESGNRIEESGEPGESGEPEESGEPDESGEPC
jgi:hypothetical protein